MPVQFKGMSEYKKHYNWRESFRSKSFTPTPEQSSDPAGQSSNATEYSRQFAPLESQSVDVQTGKKVAGIDSNRLALSYEPALQHKKRLGGPPTSLSTNFYDHPTKDAEYMVLGQQDKFSDNVRYNLKNPKNQGKIYKNKENMDEEAPPNKQLRMQKRIKPLLKERHPPVFQSPPRKSVNEDVASNITPQTPPPAPRVETSLDLEDIKATLKDKDLKDVLGESLGKEEKRHAAAKAQTKERPAAAATKVSKKEDKVGVSVMNESVQTNMKKGVAQAAPEAPAEYALKYKAGVAPPRTIKKFSEYQKQFQWKNGKKASPLLAAEQIVYTSNTELGPYKTEAIPKVSEYRREFQRWKPMEVSSSVNLNANNNNNNNNNNSVQDGKKTSVIKRSKSAAADLRKQKDEEKDPAAELKEKLKQTHGKIRRTGSEYQSNFKAPSAYYSKKGAWKGADPPQLMPAAPEKIFEDANTNNNAETDAVPLSNWFAEVVELRRRADEYRKRAQGTHFSREHLVQLMAQQNECWDVASQASSTVKALNLEAPKINRKLQKEVRDSPVLSDIELEDVEDEEEQVQPVVVKKTYKAASHEGRRLARMKRDKEAVSEQQRKMKQKAQHEREVEMGEDGDDIVDEDEGRQPTPKLKQTRTSANRHHLDLTTPAVGGALLTCPPSKSSKMIVTSRSGDSYVTASDNMEVEQKKYDMETLKTRPILGQPSGDTHPLRDDDASSDRPLNTRYVPSPAMVIANDEDKENSPSKSQKGDNKAAPKLSKTAKPSSLSSVQEGAGKTYNKSKPFLTLEDIRSNDNEAAVVDDDVMSVSMMSVASSASLASEILERARKRQKEFWGKGGDA